MLDWFAYAKLFTGLVAIVNPFGAVPLFLEMTQKRDVKERWKMCITAAASVAVILTAAMLLGEVMLKVLGISMPAFRTAGGLMLLFVALSLLHVRTSEEGATSHEDQKAFAIVPLAMPVLGGPGAISAIIVYADAGGGVLHYSMTTLAIVGVALLVLAALGSATKLSRFLGRTGMVVMSRFTGLVLLALALESIAGGIAGMFPGLR